MSFLDDLLKTIQDATQEPPAPQPRRRTQAPEPQVEPAPQPRPYVRARLPTPVRAPVAAVPQHASARSLRATLRSPAELRQALILREVLGPPLALRRP